MNKGFWAELKKPIMSLAPLSGVTDAAFRGIIAECGKPDILYTEFISCAGLCSPIGKKKLLIHLKYAPKERPLVAQIFGADPAMFYETAQLMNELGFDGIDINMGCPDKNVNKQGAGAALINTPELSKKIIRETIRGAGTLPVSVKTRIGYKDDISKNWLSHLLEAEPVSITIHGRTREEMSKPPANWAPIEDAVKLRDKLESQSLILGNGDITNIEHAKEIAMRTGVDGVMLGRAIFGNPWLFNKKRNIEDISFEERILTMLKHTQLYDSLFKEEKNFSIMRKHFASYISGFPHARDLRGKLLETCSLEEVQKIVTNWLEEYSKLKSLSKMTIKDYLTKH